MLDRFRQRTWSIQAQFLLYSLALLVPALIFSGLMIMRSASLERAAMELETTETVRTIALSIDRELAATTVTLKALGSSPSLAEGTLDAFYKQALAAQEVGGTHFFLTSKSGRQLLNTRAEWGAPLPDVSANNWKDVVDSGKPQVSGIYYGILAKGPVFSVSVPVTKRDRTLYVLSASMSPDRILEILKSAKLDEHWTATVTDHAGNVIARSKDSDAFLGKPLREDPSQGSMLRPGVWRTTDAQGTPVLRATTYSQQAGWLISTTVPLTIANRPITHSWMLIVSLAIGFMLLSALLAVLFGRSIAQPIRQLVNDARALGRGEEIEPMDTTILEVRAVADAMAGASLTRRYMERSLRESEDRLRLALASADTGTWDWDLATGSFAWDKRMRELWGLGPDDPVTYDTFIAAIEDEDRKATLEAIARAQKVDDPIEYDVEHRVQGRDGVERWVAAKGKAQFVDGAAARMTGTARDITDHKNWEQHTQILMREVTHRSKNLLAVIQAMARQTKIGSKTVADFEVRFSGRLQALAASQDLLVQRDWHGVSVTDLVKSQLGHYLDAHASQIEITGDDLVVTPEAAQNIGLAVHELSTNAAKYGALSVPQGRVQVRWTCTANGAQPQRFQMEWIERNGPEVSSPTHKGFGQVVMEQLAARALHGEAALDFRSEGVRWTLDIPASHIRWEDSVAADGAELDPARQFWPTSRTKNAGAKAKAGKS